MSRYLVPSNAYEIVAFDTVQKYRYQMAANETLTLVSTEGVCAGYSKWSVAVAIGTYVYAAPSRLPELVEQPKLSR